MKTMGHTSGSYGTLQGADSQSDPRVFGISAVLAVLVVFAVVAFKMAAPEIKAAVLSQWPAAAQLVSQTTAPRVDAPVQGSSLAEGAH